MFSLEIFAIKCEMTEILAFDWECIGDKMPRQFLANIGEM